MPNKAFKTKGGEVYEKCGVKFGPEPVAIDDADLKAVRGELGFTLGERLANDDRLVECEVPKDAKTVKPKPPSPPPKDDEAGSKSGSKSGNGKGAGDK